MQLPELVERVSDVTTSSMFVGSAIADVDASSSAASAANLFIIDPAYADTRQPRRASGARGRMSRSPDAFLPARVLRDRLRGGRHLHLATLRRLCGARLLLARRSRRHG